MVVATWAVAAGDDQSKSRVVVRATGVTRSCSPEVDRPDVIGNILKKNPDGHEKRKCGFYQMVLAREASGSLEIGFESEGLVEIVALFFLA